MRRKQVFVGIVVKRHAALITEAIYQDPTAAACRFATAITFDDKFRQTQTLPAVSWTFDRALADRVNWEKFDPKDFAEVAPAYAIADGVLDWMSDEPGASKPRSGASADGATAGGCDAFLFQANAVFIRATTVCPTNHMDSEAGYRALAGAKRCTGLPNLDARIKSAMQDLDRRVQREGRTRACAWVGSVARRVLGGAD